LIIHVVLIIYLCNNLQMLKNLQFQFLSNEESTAMQRRFPDADASYAFITIMFHINAPKNATIAILAYDPHVYLPSIRTKMLTIRNRLIRTSSPITTLLIDLSPPPFKSFHPARIHEAKENNHQTKRQSRVQSSA
jgi:hypothetical protein